MTQTDDSSSPASTPANFANPGCISIAGVLCCLVGAFMMRQAMFGRVDEPSTRFVVASFGTLFVLGGGVIIVAGSIKRQVIRHEKTARIEHPAEPWLWNPQWSSGTLADSSSKSLLGLWALTIGLNVFSGPAAGLGLREAHRSWGHYLLLLVPAAGLALLACAIVFTVRQIRFGRSTLVLQTLPGHVGGWLAGTIQTRSAIFADVLNVSLQCVHIRTMGQGDDAYTRHTTVWEDKQSLAGKLPTNRHGGSAIPVAFQIPETCQPTAKPDENTEYFWRVRAHADIPGPDFAAEFIVPVFVVPETLPAGPVPEAERVAAKLRAGMPSQSRRGDDRRISFAHELGHHRRFVFPAGRNFSAIAVMTLFAVIFAVVAIAFMFAAREAFPAYLGILFAAPIALICAQSVVMMLLRRVELRIGPHEIERRCRVLLFSSTRRFSAESIEGVSWDSNMTAGDTAYYHVDLKLTDGKTRTLASDLRRRDAEWVVDEIRQSLGLDQR